ncbi:uncharacterized protein LOC124929619 [Impatiens glandulifera]|uniref:uncharacterized protein LOC124929619 n=1 Tax=Impatiens glandulifera TaxID=253017 RepID=UPI001FB12C24|nr:uncharacterized protein LOC124929619 [Impatiens glandulifera]
MSSLILNSIALETISCISYLDNSILSLSIKIFGIPYLQHFVNNNTFSLPYLIHNRAKVLEFMQKISDSSALDNRMSQIISQRQQYQTLGSMFHSGSSSTSRPMSNNFGVHQHLIGGMRPRKNNNVGIFEEQEIMAVDQNPKSRLGTHQERIVLLIFGKGYHLTKTQLRDFFVGRFGEIIEDLIMQDVPQPLYARMLVHSSNEVKMVLRGQNCIRFTINGKYVYARKYVKRNPRASANSSSHQHSPPPVGDGATTSEEE